MELKINLIETNIWFRHESAMQKEGKGGFLKGTISIEGANISNYKLTKMELSLVSDHDSRLHCNLLRIGGKYFKIVNGSEFPGSTRERYRDHCWESG